ncbi:hypothetical protein WDZ92_04645 [Nostoc sp. NIES-2111]
MLLTLAKVAMWIYFNLTSTGNNSKFKKDEEDKEDKEDKKDRGERTTNHRQLTND